MLSVALILIADDHGRGRASIAMLAAEVWRYELQRDDGANARETLAKASRAYRELLAIGFASSYEVSGQAYFEIRNWSRHQKIDRPSAPKVPPPNRSESLDSRDTRETLARDSRDTRETLATDQDQEGTRKGPGACNAREGSSVDAETVRAEYLTRWSRATDRQAPLIARGPGSSVWLELSREAGDAASLAKLLDAAFADDFVASTGWTPAAIRGSAQRLLATGAKRNTQRGMVRAATAADHAADADDELPLEEQLKRFQRRGGHA